jgi:cellulose synthase/poly-beta-1,6-N-acetylglucosamine synthase-like glycosyltransferase
MMAILKVASVVLGASALLAALPGTFELLLLTLGTARKRKIPDQPDTATLRLAVVIPAHDEALLITRCVESVSLSARRYEGCEIVVVADNCSDETAALAVEAGARVLVRQNAELRGKGYALRMAFDQLQADGFNAFLVVDADSIVSPNLVREAGQRLAAGATAVQARYRVANDNASMRTRLMDLAFLAFNVARPRGRAGWKLSAGILGNGFALRAETLQQVPWDAASIVEDLEYHLRLVSAGQRVDFIDAATVYGEIPAGGKAAKVQRSRWEGGRLRMAREWAPKLATQLARGEWRVAEPLLDLLTLPLAYHVLLLTFAALILPAPWREVAVAAMVVVLMHVISACVLGGNPWKTARALFSAPFYIIWKLTTLSGVFSASRRSAGWLRSARDGQVNVGPGK